MGAGTKYVYKSGKLSLETASISELQQLLEKLVAATSKRSVSVVVPTYNEEGNIGRLIEAISASMKSAGIPDFEVVVVDDSSEDSTPLLIDKFALGGRVASVHRRGIRGVFSAIADGVRAARSDVVVIMDADFSHPPAVIPEMLKSMRESGADIVSASRFMSGGGIRAPFARAFGTVLFNKLIGFLMGGGITDWTGGFHAMGRERFLQLSFCYPARWGEFDLELLYRARMAGWRIVEVPFVYNFREEGVSKSAKGFGFLLGYAWLYGRRALQLRFGR